MLISAIGNKASSTLKQQKGLTLVEVLIVIAMLGLVAAVVMLTVPEEKDPAEIAAFKLARSIKAANNYAIISGKVIGIDISEAGYQFLIYQSDAWVPFIVPGGRRQSINLEDGLGLEFIKEAGLVAGTAGMRSSSSTNTPIEKKENLFPELTILPSGNGERADFLLHHKGESWRVKYDQVISVGRVEDDAR